MEDRGLPAYPCLTVSQSPLRRTPRRLLSLSARRRLLHALARGFVALTMRVEVRGRHHLPPGPVLVSPNHLSHLDPVVVATLMDSPPEVVGLSDLKQELIAPIFLLYSVIPVRRDEVDRDVLRNILLALGRKERVLIFPEAHISRTGALEPARSGVGYLALHAGVPVVPVAITGTENAIQSWKRLKRPRVTVTFAAPFTPAPDATQPRRVQRQAITDELMRRIAAQLPVAYQGYYRKPAP
jgi:1-acyl-sn-glycerol-3-phosphate acyltransferase